MSRSVCTVCHYIARESFNDVLLFCSLAFAELQIEVTDLTTDMSTASIPYLNFEMYAMRVLFPALETHPILEKDVRLCIYLCCF